MWCCCFCPAAALYQAGRADETARLEGRRSLLAALPACLPAKALAVLKPDADADFSASLDKLEKMASTSYNDPLACKKRADGETRADCLEQEDWELECERRKQQGKKCVPPPADLLSYR
ncbi:unnamed protein product [Effrenium voratum]|uniref:Uncharacterized protein n=1 Tax=Effrenium voratum TaxID=2562239 RepID=A0AA36ISP8_9DINO|nr:unnamed protein product [Effrenium voratum]